MTLEQVALVTIAVSLAAILIELERISLALRGRPPEDAYPYPTMVGAFVGTGFLMLIVWGMWGIVTWGPSAIGMGLFAAMSFVERLWAHRGGFIVALVVVLLTGVVSGIAWLVPWPRWATEPNASLSKGSLVALLTAGLTIGGLLYIFGRS